MDGKQLYDLKQERAELVKSLRDHMEEFQDKLEDGDGVAKRMKIMLSSNAKRNSWSARG